MLGFLTLPIVPSCLSSVSSKEAFHCGDHHQLECIAGFDFGNHVRWQFYMKAVMENV